MPKQASIVKITRPRLAKVLPRPRLFRLLAHGLKSTVIWVTGPGGSGKTTLVASWLDATKMNCLWYNLDAGDSDPATFFYYIGMAAKNATPRIKSSLPFLTAEYRGDIPTFTRKYFENLYSRLRPSTVIVLDNYHHLPVESPFHNVIRDGLSVIPHGFTFIVCSRGSPPQSLAYLSTYGRIKAIGWDDLKFDRREAGSLLGPLQRKKSVGDLLTRVHRMTTGWAAGLVLMRERLRAGIVEPRELDRYNPQAFFDYFAAELFEKVDLETQSFLLKTSWMTRIMPKAAVVLTGNPGTGQLLDWLNTNHFFTERSSTSDPVYQYHPLFRAFLQARAATALPPGELKNIQCHAAELLEEAGQVEDAAELYRTCEAWDGYARLIVTNARSMMSQGRYGPLYDWLRDLPLDVLDRDPWLLYWKGACRMPLHLPEGRQYFERALTLFRKKDDVAGAFLAWSGAIESRVQEMGNIKQLEPWITLVFELMKKYDFPSPEIEDEITARIFTAIPWYPSDPVFILWRKRAMELINRNADPTLRLMTAFYLLAHHMWIGDYSTGRIILDIIRRLVKTCEKISPLAYCMGRMCEGWFVWLTGDHQLCYDIMLDALAKSRESGVHIWDRQLTELGATASLCRGDLSESGRLLEQMAVGLESSRLFDRFYYHLNSAWRFMMLGDVSQAYTHQKLALELETKTGFPINASEARFGIVFVLLARNDRKKAKEHASALHNVGSSMGSSLVEYLAILADTVIAFDAGNEQTGLGHLRDAMALAKEKGYVYFKWWLPTVMTKLCINALEASIEPDYVKHLIRTCNLIPEEPPIHINSWPWPVRIFTLGGFRLMVDDKPASVGGKVQKKPLEMLKAIIAFGGREVGEELVIDALWPEADGDTGRISFKTTLHRLRHLLGKEEMVQLHEGRMSLDQRFCWTDVWAFERMLERLTSGTRDSTGTKGRTRRDAQSDTMLRLEKALQLYRGHFLSDDEDKPWAVSLREQLKRKFVQAVSNQGERAEEDKAWKKAIAAYERGLEVDDLAEEFYQRLMACYLKLGKRADAVKVYKRCKSVLSAKLGIEPSEETEGIYAKING